MQAQTYARHTRIVPLFHIVLFGLLVLTLVGSCVNVWKSIGDHQRLYSACLIAVLTACVLLLYFYCRIFPLKAQDRAIRAEENLRCYVLTGKLLDPRLSVRQIVALRFASDGEFAELCGRAAEENLEADQIKRAIRSWRADHYRV